MGAALGLMFEVDFPYGDNDAMDLVSHMLMGNVI